MVRFKNGSTWTEEKKYEFMKTVLCLINTFPLKEIFAEIRPQFDNASVAALMREFYWLLKTEPKAVESLMKDLDDSKIPYTNPFMDRRVKSDSKEEQISTQAIVSEDSVLTDVSHLLDGLMKLNGPETSSFIKGLSFIVDKANQPVNEDDLKKKEDEIAALKSQIEELTADNKALQEKNQKLHEDFNYVNTVIENFIKMNPAEKIGNMDMITRNVGSRLKTTVDQFGSVVRVSRVV